MSNRTAVPVTSFPILGILGLIFVTLKLLHQIEWSWWWVTCPFWGLPALLGAVGVIGGAIYLAARGVELLLARRRKGKKGPVGIMRHVQQSPPQRRSGARW